MLRRVLVFFLLLTLAAAPARADEPFRIGVLNDQSGPYADLSGPGGAESARMAIEDFGGSVLGRPIELLVADHQNKVDVGLAVARQWYDERGVRAIFDITNSGVGLAVQDLAKARDRIVIFDSASSSDLTAKACSPNGVQWNADNWSNGVALMRILIKQKLDSFFFITADYAFGASLEADARDVNAIGLDVAHGLTFMQSWYWDLDDKTREFAKRFYARRGRMPNDNQVALYSSVRHYLEAVAKAGTDDAASVMKAMREAPIHDIFTANGTIRADGRVLYDRYLMRVKSPAESKYPWDYLTVVAKVPAPEAFRPPGAGGCTLAVP